MKINKCVQQFTSSAKNIENNEDFPPEFFRTLELFVDLSAASKKVKKIERKESQVRKYLSQ